MAQMTKNLSVIQDTWIQPLGWDHPPGEGNGEVMSNILAWRIPWTEKLGELQSMGHKESDTTE